MLFLFQSLPQDRPPAHPSQQHHSMASVRTDDGGKPSFWNEGKTSVPATWSLVVQWKSGFGRMWLLRLRMVRPHPVNVYTALVPAILYQKHLINSIRRPPHNPPWHTPRPQPFHQSPPPPPPLKTPPRLRHSPRMGPPRLCAASPAFPSHPSHLYRFTRPRYAAARQRWRCAELDKDKRRDRKYAHAVSGYWYSAMLGASPSNFFWGRCTPAIPSRPPNPGRKTDYRGFDAKGLARHRTKADAGPAEHPTSRTTRGHARCHQGMGSRAAGMGSSGSGTRGTGWEKPLCRGAVNRRVERGVWAFAGLWPDTKRQWYPAKIRHRASSRSMQSRSAVADGEMGRGGG